MAPQNGISGGEEGSFSDGTVVDGRAVFIGGCKARNGENHDHIFVIQAQPSSTSRRRPPLPAHHNNNGPDRLHLRPTGHGG